MNGRQRLPTGCHFTPIVGARVTHYENQEFDPQVFGVFDVNPDTGTAFTDDSATRELYELGFDLEALAYATYTTVNSTWSIDGLRHILKPTLRYRYVSGSDPGDAIAPIDREAFNLKPSPAKP